MGGECSPEQRWPFDGDRNTVRGVELQKEAVLDVRWFTSLGIAAQRIMAMSKNWHDVDDEEGKEAFGKETRRLLRELPEMFGYIEDSTLVRLLPSSFLRESIFLLEEASRSNMPQNIFQTVRHLEEVVSGARLHLQTVCGVDLLGLRPGERIRFHVRWMIRADMAGVMETERTSFRVPQAKEEILSKLCARNCIGMIVEPNFAWPCERPVAGFMLYALHEDCLETLDFAVHSAMRRHGAGTAMMQTLLQKLSPHRRISVDVSVHERNLPMQLFLRDQGFQADPIIWDRSETSGDGNVVMKYQLPADFLQPPQDDEE